MDIRSARAGDGDVLSTLLAAYLAEQFPGHIGSTMAALCARTQREGGTYLQGVAYDRASAVGCFYERIAVAFDSAECHCSGRAFRQLAALSGQPPRTIVRALPPKAWNHEP